MVTETRDLTEMMKGSRGTAGHSKPLTKEGLAAGGQMTAAEGRHSMPSKEEGLALRGWGETLGKWGS